jgi:peptidoglycan-N-acetylglucosamine deacetylase
MPFYQSTPKILHRIFSKLFWHGNTFQPNIYLTFDDGPHPEITPWVMTELAKYNFKATFFCVGQNAQKHPQIIAELLKNGHQIGNHTMHHLKGWQNSLDNYVKDVKECQNYISSNLFRPPYGRISRKQIKALMPHFKIIMWSLLSCDYLKDLNCQESLKILKKKTKNGSVVVFHDSAKAEKNLKILLPQYLQFINDKGFNCIIL